VRDVRQAERCTAGGRSTGLGVTEA
jgi:hypothetical protein